MTRKDKAFITRLEELRSMPYQDYLQTAEWEKTRKRALALADYRCQICNAADVKLNAHHRDYERRGCERDGDVVVLCERCHQTHHGIIPPVRGFNRKRVVVVNDLTEDGMFCDYSLTALSREEDAVIDIISRHLRNHVDAEIVIFLPTTDDLERLAGVLGDDERVFALHPPFRNFPTVREFDAYRDELLDRMDDYFAGVNHAPA